MAKNARTDQVLPSTRCLYDGKNLVIMQSTSPDELHVVRDAYAKILSPSLLTKQEQEEEGILLITASNGFSVA